MAKTKSKKITKTKEMQTDSGAPQKTLNERVVETRANKTVRMILIIALLLVAAWLMYSLY